MSKPYDDEGFEAIKGDDQLQHKGILTILETVRRLIATVEKWKEEAFTYQSKAVRSMERILEYKKEVESLKGANVKLLDESKRDYTALLEENAKLREELENWKDATRDYGFAVKNLKEQNAKLTAELDAALKRIEEMEGINHKWKN